MPENKAERLAAARSLPSLSTLMPAHEAGHEDRTLTIRRMLAKLIRDGRLRVKSGVRRQGKKVYVTPEFSRT
jgi:hypothetical protein